MNKKIFLKLIGKDSISDSEYSFYFEVAVKMIENYLRIGEEYFINVEHCYEEQCVLLASHVYNIHSNVVASTQNSGIKSISSNGRSVSFMDAMELANQVSIPQYIKDMLPKPKSKVRVW